ncbi:MAG TPA: hypothetical protein VN963_00215 [bacterium]|nr:hypothetical protein [bacterium]
MESENKTVFETAIKVKSGEYRFTVKDSPRSGRYFLMEDVRMKDGKSRTERVVIYPELMDAFDVEYQKAKAFMESPSAQEQQQQQ